MKVQIFSDIHIECRYNQTRLVPTDGIATHCVWDSIVPQAPVALIAGDIDARHFIDTVNEIATKFEKVFCVYGNHEFYGKDYTWRPSMKKLVSNVSILDRSAVDYENKLFVGCTLWTDFDNQDFFTMNGAGQGINDFYSIRNGGDNKKFTPRIAYELHMRDRAWLKLMIEQNRHKEVVVMTHFMPSYQCVNARWKTNPGTDLLNRYFSANCDDLLEIVNPGTLWVNGHTHDAYDMELGNARVVCNPLGYPGEHKYAFNQKVIEL